MADISKIKLPNGDIYNVKDSTALHTPAVIMSTNPFAEPATEHGSSALYIPKIDNVLYCADKRFDVSVAGDYKSFSGNRYLFDGSYDGEILQVENDKTVTITIDFSNLSASKFPGYPYGFIYITFYYVCMPKTITGRVYNNYSPQGVGWKDITFQNCFGRVYRAENTYYGLQTIEITVTGDGSNSYGHTSITEIDMHLTRPSPYMTPFLSKYDAQTLYYDLTAPKFIGSGANLTNLNGSNISSGTVAEARIAALPASKITSGTFDAARIPNLDAGKITSGTMAAARLPNASTAGKGIVQLNDTLDSNSVTQAATANAVKEVYNLAKKSQVIKKVENTNIIHIEDAAEKPLKECKIDIEPVQDLHGYDHPWPAGGGKNLAPVNNWSGHSGVISDMNLNIPANTQFTLSLFGTVDTGSNQYALVFIFSDDTESGWVNLVPSATRMSATRTYEKDVVGLRYYSHNGGWSASASITLTVEDFQIELGSTATSYVPYSNICPITGWTGAKVTRVGKNLLDNDTVVVQAASSWANKKQLPNKIPPGTYTISITTSSTSAWNFRLYDINNNNIGYAATLTNTPGRQSVTFTSTGTAVQYGGYCNAATTMSEIQLELGSTTTNYEPYSGTTYSITFPTEAGTVYNGTLDVVNGVLTVDKIVESTTELSARSWNVVNLSGKIGLRTVVPYIKQAGHRDLQCSHLPYAGVDTNVIINSVTNAAVNYYNLVVSMPDAFTTESEFKTYLQQQETNGTPFQILMDIEPQIYQLTPQEITTLLGTNNIWVDTGNISCTYYVESDINTELNNYIPKSIGTAKGDIIYYSDNNTPNRLGIGNEGQVLKVNASGLPNWSNDNNTNTTYTFTSGTNQFTATSSDGTTQTVNVTPQIPDASTSSAGIVQLSTATNSTSTTQAATPSAVKSAYDLAASKTNNTGTVTSVTLTAGNGISITDNSVPITTIGGRTITNTGVTSVSQGTTNGTINVTTNGSTSAVAIRGLGSAAYTASTAYATAAQGGKADAAMPKSGGTFTGAVTLHSDPTTNLMAATKQYVDNNVSISDNISSGTKIATITINGVNTDLYSPGTPQTISVTQSSSTPTLEFITSTNSSNSSTLTGVTTTALANGKMIVYRLAYALTGSPVTLTLSNTSGTSLGNYPVYIDGTTQCSDIYRAGTMLFLVFYNNKFTIVNPFGLAG